MNQKIRLRETANLLEILSQRQEIDGECVTLTADELYQLAERVNRLEDRLAVVMEFLGGES